MPDSVPSSRGNFLLLALLIVAGLCGNCMVLPLFFGVDFLFGSIFILLAACLYGPAWGLIAAILAGSSTYYLWGHPWAIPMFAAEAVFVAVLYRRWTRNLVLIGGLFWVLAGIPMVLMFYGGILKMETTFTLLVALKQSVNGIFNALLANLLLVLAPAIWRAFRREPLPEISLHQLLFLLIASIVFLPALLLSVLEGRREILRIEENIEQRLEINSRALASHLRNQHEHQFHTVQALAQLATAPLTASALQNALERSLWLFPNFRAVYLVETNGSIIASARSPALGDWHATPDFAAERYFILAAGGQAPVLSDRLTSPEEVMPPIQALAAASTPREQPPRLAVAFIDMTAVGRYFQEQARGSDLLIQLVDSRRQLIAQSRSEDSTRIPDASWERRSAGLAGFTVLSPPEDLPQMIRWRRSYYARERDIAAGFPWRLAIQVPLRPYQETLYRGYIIALAVALGFAASGLAMAEFISGRLSKPLAELAALTGRAPEQMLGAAEISQPRSLIAEVRLLMENFSGMMRALRTTFRELNSRTAQIAEANSELENEIQERRRTEAALRASENRFRMLFQQAPVSIQVFAPDGVCLEANASWEELWGARRSELAGYHLLDDPEVARTGILPSLRKAFAGEPVFIPAARYESAGSSKPGRVRWVEAYAYPVKGPDGAIQEVVLMHRDVTEENNAALMIRELNEELEKRVQERTASLQEAQEQLETFCYSVAHDLRAPLRAMQGFSHALLEDYAPQLDETGQDFARRILNAATRMDLLVRDLLAYARLSRDELAFEPVDLCRIVQDVCDDFAEPIREAGGTLNAGPVHALVLGHESTLKVVLANLLSNAIKFVCPGTPPAVRLWAETRGPITRLLIQDNGIGIDPRHHDRIFRVFERLHGLDAYPGTGMGLAIVHAAMTRMNGDVGLESSPGSGSCFWIELATVSDRP